MDIKDNFYYANLFAYYKNLLTSKQTQYLSMYYEQDYAIVEIAQYFEVSKESVFDLIKRVNKKLVDYENKLKLFDKTTQIEEILQKNEIDNEIIKTIIEIL